MKILAFDTSSIACSVALLNSDDGSDQITSMHEIAPKQHAKLILTIIQNLLNSASLSLNELDAVAYGCGPGSFTGIRIASCLAQGLGFAKHIPIIKISSMAALAQEAFMSLGSTDLLVAIDARMQQVYWGTYKTNSSSMVELIGDEDVCDPKTISKPSKKENWLAVGDGWEKYEDQLVKTLGFKPTINASLLPSARAILQLAKNKFEKSEWVATHQAIPHYLR